MSTRLTSTVFAQLLQMILSRFLSFDTFASFQTPGGQAVSCKNNRQSGKHQVKVFLSDFFWIFTLIAGNAPLQLHPTRRCQTKIGGNDQRTNSTSTFQSERSYQYSHHF